MSSPQTLDSIGPGGEVYFGHLTSGWGQLLPTARVV